MCYRQWPRLTRTALLPGLRCEGTLLEFCYPTQFATASHELHVGFMDRHTAERQVVERPFFP